MTSEQLTAFTGEEADVRLRAQQRVQPFISGLADGQGARDGALRLGVSTLLSGTICFKLGKLFSVLPGLIGTVLFCGSVRNCVGSRLPVAGLGRRDDKD